MDLDDLVIALGGAPSLPGARCRGRHRLFDPAAEHESILTVQARHAQALGLCEHCPALTRRQEWVATLPANQRPRGVVAGTIGGGA